MLFYFTYQNWKPTFWLVIIGSSIMWNFWFVSLFVLSFASAIKRFHSLLICFFILNLLSYHMLFLYPAELFETQYLITPTKNLWNSTELFIVDSLFLEELTLLTFRFSNWLLSWNFYLYSNVLALNKFQLITSMSHTVNLYQLIAQPFTYSIWIETIYTTALSLPLVFLYIQWMLMFKKPTKL
jgi:hypothetical protein